MKQYENVFCPAETSPEGGVAGVPSGGAAVGGSSPPAVAFHHSGYTEMSAAVTTMSLNNDSISSRSRTTSEADSLSSVSSATASAQRMVIPSSSPNGEGCSGISSTKVFLYTLDKFEAVDVVLDGDTAESVCHRLCKRLKFKPIVELLFSLRICNDNCYLPACRKLKPNTQYEFRVRFKMPDHTKLKSLDKNAFEYYYMQVRHDLIHMKYPDINYAQDHEKILGLVVADMYLEMIKDSTKTADALCKEYKRFTPKDVQRFAKSKIKDTMRHIVRKDYDQYYVMESYLSQVNSIGPLYLKEEYTGETAYQSEEASGAMGSPSLSSLEYQNMNGSGASASSSSSTRHNLKGLFTKSSPCALKIEIYPEYRKEAVLRINYKHTHSFMTYPIRGLMVIVLEKDRRKVLIEWLDRTQLRLVMPNEAAAVSLVSGLATYYRLMHCWTTDLCVDLVTPSLQRLLDLKCHGPISFPVAHDKLMKFAVGYYLIRQCDQLHDTYNLDMKTSTADVRTFRVTKGDGADEWYLHGPATGDGKGEKSRRFASLVEIAKSIQLKGESRMRVGPPTLAGELPSLLLCQKQVEMDRVAMMGDEVKGEPTFIDKMQLRLLKGTERIVEGNALAEIWADWTVQNNMFVKVTLKYLKSDQIQKNTQPFLNLAQKWCSLKSPDVLRIYGLMLYNPSSLVMERTMCTLSDLLRRKRPQTRLLIDAAQSLARALNYLHSVNFIHKRIRCSTLHVVAEDEDKLIVRLGDPGIICDFSRADLPWLPVEYHNGPKAAKDDLNTDIWAFATTLWQIFNDGQVPSPDCFKVARYLPKSDHTPDGLYRIMQEGWDLNPEKRFNSQSLFTRLYIIRQEYEHVYQAIRPSASHHPQQRYNGGPPPPPHRRQRNGDSESLASKSSLMSADTEQVDLISNGHGETTASSVGDFSGSESSISRSSNYVETPTQSTMVHGGSSATSTENMFGMEFMEHVLYASTYKVELQGVIGSGNFGTVREGVLFNNRSKETRRVAVKIIKVRNTSFKDFENEGKIMKAVDHENIVKIIDYHCDNEMTIIMEYMDKGNLGAYLAGHRGRLTEQQLLRFARDIASGMEYLQLNDIVHRDLAVRNVLVGDDEKLKISDFGLARFVDASGYYMVQDMLKELPIHYYAPETLEYSRYSIKSDVWSYGVTLFEIYKREHESLMIAKGDAQALLQALASGKRLPRSETCPERVYDELMRPCWEYEKEHRPTFTIILKKIRSIEATYGEQI